MSTMRALILEEPGLLQLRNIPIPTPRAGELLVRVEAATTCGTDLKAFVRGHPQIPMPGPFGHEYSGVVVEAGEGAPFKAGDAVMGVHSAPCQQCYWCARGQENLCDSIMSTKVLGSYAEYLLIPARIARLNVFLKPDDVSFEKAALLEPFACVAQGVSMLDVREDSSVLVIGPGAIGLMFVGALKLKGVKNVVLAGRNETRLAAGAAMGAQTVKVDAVQSFEGRGFDFVIECTGQVSVWEASVDYVRRGGDVLLFGGPPGGTRASFNTHRLHYDQITLLSPFHFGTAAVKMARNWLIEPSLDFSFLITGDRALEDGPAVFADLEAGRGIKYAFKPHEGAR
jgi:L-iditol 2-dehydrogenase